ncbi:unnamed protein product [Arabidopsis thaliana]|nr:unnamed protein product [Arabidopsis thaliana]
MTMISDLSKDLVEEILSKAPITSLGAVRSTHKQWNALSKGRLLYKAEAKDQFLGFMVMDHRFLSMIFHLNGILKGDGEGFDRPSIREVGDIVNQIDISKVFQCDGLVLCVPSDNSSVVVWNPYLGQTKWIEAREPHDESDMFALGYDKDKNHKILRLYDECYYYYEVYNFKTESWGEEDHLPGWDIDSYNRGVSLNGNTYFLTQEQRAKDKYRVFLLCFNFTTEKFENFIAMPFKYHRKYVGTLSCVGNEKLAALYQRWDTGEMAIWVTTKIESNEVLWSNLFKVDMKPLVRFGFQQCKDEAGSFFIDEEKKLAVVFNLDKKRGKRNNKTRCYHTAYIIGEKGYLKKEVLGEAVEVRKDVYRSALVCSSSYVPSLEKINQIEEEEEDKCKSIKMVDTKRQLETSFGLDFELHEDSCFFIDEEKKLAVVFDLAESKRCKTANAYIIGVQIDDPIARRDKRERNRKWMSKRKEKKRKGTNKQQGLTPMKKKQEVHLLLINR